VTTGQRATVITDLPFLLFARKKEEISIQNVSTKSIETQMFGAKKPPSL
jgi:hypothetical protein